MQYANSLIGHQLKILAHRRSYNIDGNMHGGKIDVHTARKDNDGHDGTQEAGEYAVSAG